METSVNVRALLVALLYYLLLEGVIIGFSTGQGAERGELPSPQIILFAAFSISYPVLAYLYLRGVKWGFVITMAVVTLAVLTQTPLMLLWIGRMSEWWIAAWSLLYLLPALIIFLCYKAYRGF